MGEGAGPTVSTPSAGKIQEAGKGARWVKVQVQQ